MTTQEEIAGWVTAGGVPCQVSFFPGTVPALTQKMAVVHRKQAKGSLEEFSVTVAVPAFLGGKVCEETAWKIYEMLTGRDGKCSLAPCGFDAMADCFFQEVTVHWTEN